MENSMMIFCNMVDNLLKGKDAPLTDYACPKFHATPKDINSQRRLVIAVAKKAIELLKEKERQS